MDQDSVNEIIACLPQGKTRFDYFKDRYALLLLSYLIEPKIKIADLKRSAYARLLERPVVKKTLASASSGWLNRYLVNMIWDNPSYTFLLTLTTWGGYQRTWQQTSRPGYNLVLQLNFSNQHEQPYRQLLKPTTESIFKCNGHPIMKRGQRSFFRETLAWARIDLDFKDNEALIEEIQSDWIREAQENLREVLKFNNNEPTEIFIDGMEGDSRDLKTYFNEILKPYIQLWDEAMLTATLHFIHDELGINNIFYHSYETGCAIKKCQPPRSLYTQLPRQFCFHPTMEAPQFLQRIPRFRQTMKKLPQPFWYKLNFTNQECYYAH